jgi:hypothetical protein
MRALKKFAVSLLVSTTVASSASWATGFPTVDIANLISQVTQYASQLEQYGTQLEQKAIEMANLTQAINQYQQMLVDYNHYLTLVRGLKDYVDTNTLNEMLKGIDIDPSRDPFSPGFNATIYTDAGMVSTNNELKRFYQRSRSMGEMTTDLAAIGNPRGMTSDTQRKFEKSELSVLQANDSKSNLNEIYERSLETVELQKALNAVTSKPESQVATLQLIATQNQAVMNNLQTIAKINNQNMNYANQLTNEIYSNQAAIADIEIQRLKVIANRTLVANGSGFMSF